MIPLYYHEDLARYDFGADHPFKGSRFSDFMTALARRHPGARALFDVRMPAPAGDDLLLLVHNRSYIDRVAGLEARRGFLSVDTQVLPGSVAAARLIVGGSVAAARAALAGGVAASFGGLHHAGSSYGEGFCIFNDVAIAARCLLAEGLERVLILDTDAHQGNGTMDVFYDDPRVLFISLHQDPTTLYPGKGFVDEIGRGPGAGYTVNIPLPVMADGRLYDTAMSEIVFPLMECFDPQAIIRNGGCDPLAFDTLTDLGLDLDGLSSLVAGIREAAARRGTPLVDLFLSGYGGYVTEGWLAIVRGLTGERMTIDVDADGRSLPAHRRDYLDRFMRATLDDLKRELRPYWKIF